MAGLTSEITEHILMVRYN